MNFIKKIRMLAKMLLAEVLPGDKRTGSTTWARVLFHILNFARKNVHFEDFSDESGYLRPYFIGSPEESTLNLNFDQKRALEAPNRS